MMVKSNEKEALAHKPLISVITPVYNLGDVMLDTAESIYSQRLENFEWIIVDDGSISAETKTLLQTLVDIDSRVQVINHTANKGLPAARNTGIKNSKSDFLFFLDGDDLIDPTFLEKAYLFLYQNKEYAFANSYVVGFGAQDYKWKGGFHEGDLFLKENRNTSCFMARREVFEQVQFNEEMTEGCEDWDFWLHAASKGFWGYTIPEYLFYYRRSETNKWETLKGKETLFAIQQQLKLKYEKALIDGFPEPERTTYSFGYTPSDIKLPEVQLSPGKRLLCVFPWLQIGGADQYNLNLLSGLMQKGWAITVITTLQDQHLWEDKFKEVTADIFHLAHLGTEHSYSSLVTYLINTRKPDVLFLSNSMYGYYLLPYLKAKHPHLPIVDYLHCEDIGWYKGGYPYFSALNTHLLDQTFTTSRNLSDWCVNSGADKSKINVCYINVDTEKIKRNDTQRQKLRAAIGIKEDTPLVLYVARLTQQKQPIVFVETIAALKNKGLKFYAVAIGDGPDRQMLEEAIKSKNLLDTIQYLGSQSNETVLQYMDAADVFFLPSLYEGIALSIFEAMAKSLAIVGADVGGQSELVTKECGFLISRKNPEHDVKAYIDVLAPLLQNPAQIGLLGEKARRRVENHFGLQKMVDEMHERLLAVQAKIPDASAYGDAYAHMMNRMLYLEEQNKELLELAGSKAFRMINKYKRPYNKLKDIYHRLKRISKE